MSANCFDERRPPRPGMSAASGIWEKVHAQWNKPGPPVPGHQPRLSKIIEIGESDAGVTLSMTASKVGTSPKIIVDIAP